MPGPASPSDADPTGSSRETGGAADVMTGRFYAELRGIAQRIFASERASHTLQPTAVVNEACLRLMKDGEIRLPEAPREQQLAIAARVLKQVLIDHARSRDAQKRGGPAPGTPGTPEIPGNPASRDSRLRLDLERDILAEHATQVDFDGIHRALERLRQLNERQAEVVTLRMFAGLTMEHIATVLGVSKRSAESDWTVARAWLRRELATTLGEAQNG